MEKITDKLKQQTLLLIDSTLNLSEDRLKQVYKYPYRIVSFEEHEELVASSAPSYIFITFFWDDYLLFYTYYFIDSESNIPIERFEKATHTSVNIPFKRHGIGKSSYRESFNLDEKFFENLNNIVNGTLKQKNLEVVFQ